MRQTWSNGRRRLTPSPGRIASTNDLGQFRIYGLPPGEYYVSASMRGSAVEMMDMELMMVGDRRSRRNRRRPDRVRAEVRIRVDLLSRAPRMSPKRSASRSPPARKPPAPTSRSSRSGSPASPASSSAPRASRSRARWCRWCRPAATSASRSVSPRRAAPGTAPSPSTTCRRATTCCRRARCRSSPRRRATT